MAAQKSLLDLHNIQQNDIHFLVQDMSPRRYHRLPNKGLLLMEGPQEVIESYVHVANTLRNLGARVPKLIAWDSQHAIIEDWGDQTFTQLLEKGHPAENLYQRATNTLIQLHKACLKQVNQGESLAPYSSDVMTKEALLFPEWCSPLPLNSQTLDTYQKIWHNLYTQCPPTPLVLVLRDYHVDNIMLTPQNELGLLDFQDALWGPSVYDLTSLLEDARIDVDQNIADTCFEQYIQAMNIQRPGDFKLAYNIWGLGRHLKILGVFTRYAKREGNTSKLVHIPRVKKHVTRLLRDPIFDELKHWINQHCFF